MSEALYVMAGNKMAVTVGGKEYMARKLKPVDIDYMKAIIKADRKKQIAEIRESMPDGPEKTAMIKELIGEVTFNQIGAHFTSIDGAPVLAWLSVRRETNDFKSVEEFKEAIDFDELMSIMENGSELLFGGRKIKNAEGVDSPSTGI